MDNKTASANNNDAKGKHVPFNQKTRFWIALLFVVLIIAGIQSYRAYKNRHPKVQPLPVVLAQTKTQDVPVYFFALGNVTPTYSITVRTQLNGILMRVLFQEGQMVKAGDLLAEIDDRPYQAQLVEYEGQYARDKAQLVNASLDLQRYQTLWKQDSISEQTLATQQALVQQLQGTLKLDEGLLQATKVNLIYTKITSPIDGRIGLRLVDPGNFVQTSDTNGIAIVNSLNPITIIFTIPEDNIPPVLKRINAHKTLQIEAFDRQQSKQLAVGKLLTIDNQIDTNTGTVKLKAEFQNDQNKLFPNQFVNIRLLLKTLHNAIVVPTAAIQRSSTKGNYVYVLNQDQTVSEKPVVVGVTLDDTTSIASGLTINQSVVVEGADKLTDGAKVFDASKQLSPSSTKLTQAANRSKRHTYL